jgi:hypothetical protein
MHQPLASRASIPWFEIGKFIKNVGVDGDAEGLNAKLVDFSIEPFALFNALYYPVGVGIVGGFTHAPYFSEWVEMGKGKM